MKKLVLASIFTAVSAPCFAEKEFSVTTDANACLRQVASDIVKNDLYLKDYLGKNRAPSTIDVGAVEDSGHRMQAVTLRTDEKTVTLHFRAYSGTWIFGNSKKCFATERKDLFLTETYYKVLDTDTSAVKFETKGTRVRTAYEEIENARAGRRRAGEY